MSGEHNKAKKMRWIIWIIALLIIAIIGLCWYFYPESYEFFGETISDLGMVYSHDEGLPNTTSQWIFTFGFILIAILIIILFIMYLTETEFYVSTVKKIILVLFAIGAIGTSIPYDYIPLSWMHFVGAALFVGGFGAYNFVSQLLRYIRKHTDEDSKKNFDYFLDLTFVILVFIVTIWYLTSGILGLLDVEKIGILSVFNTALSQKFVLFIAGIAAFLLDPEDI